MLDRLRTVGSPRARFALISQGRLAQLIPTGMATHWPGWAPLIVRPGESPKWVTMTTQA